MDLYSYLCILILYMTEAGVLFMRLHAVVLTLSTINCPAHSQTCCSTLPLSCACWTQCAHTCHPTPCRTRPGGLRPRALEAQRGPGAGWPPRTRASSTGTSPRPPARSHRLQPPPPAAGVQPTAAAPTTITAATTTTWSPPCSTSPGVR